MTTDRVNQRMEEIRNDKPEWDEKQVAIQAVGEIIEENEEFVFDFLLSQDFDGSHKGIIWLSEEIDYIPAQTLEILGKNGMNVEPFELKDHRQVVFS